MDVELTTLSPRSPRPLEEVHNSPFNKSIPAERQGAENVKAHDNLVDEIQEVPRTPASSASFPAATDAMKRKARIQFATVCWSLCLAGWNDGTTGPLLPRIQAVYNIGFAVVSLIFVFNCVGFVSGAAANIWLTDRLGFGKVMVLGALFQVAGYAIEAPAPPFPVLVLGYTVNGFGLALQNAGANVYVAALKDNASTKLSIMHAVYGTGALCAPLVATQFAQARHWSFHYLVLLSIALSNVALLTAVFRFKDQDTCLAEIGQAPNHEGDVSNKYKQIFGLRAMHLIAFFILLYVGIEVTLGGWIVTYIIQLRGGGPTSGYISSGFFGGLTIGRITLLWVTQKLGDRRAPLIYATLAVCLELVIWLVPSLVGGAVAVSFVGLLLGPIYPVVMHHTSRVLPPWLLTGCIGWIAGFGQAGSAFLPFLTGVLASKVGIKSLQPLLVSMMGFMIFLWVLVPSAPRRFE